MIPIRMSTIRHHPFGHHRACNNSGDAEMETLCCMVRSRSAFSTRRLVTGLSSVAKRRGVDLGATLVRRQVAVRRIVEKDGCALDEAVVEGPLQIDLLVLQVGIERGHHLERAVHSL